jgi:hypothetical protein
MSLGPRASTARSTTPSAVNVRGDGTCLNEADRRSRLRFARRGRPTSDPRSVRSRMRHGPVHVGLQPSSGHRLPSSQVSPGSVFPLPHSSAASRAASQRSIPSGSPIASVVTSKASLVAMALASLESGAVAMPPSASGEAPKALQPTTRPNADGAASDTTTTARIAPRVARRAGADDIVNHVGSGGDAPPCAVASTPRNSVA